MRTGQSPEPRGGSSVGQAGCSGQLLRGQRLPFFQEAGHPDAGGVVPLFAVRGCPTAHWCSSTPLWPGLSWTPGGSSSAAPVSTPTAPSAPSSTASRPRSSGCLPAAVRGRDGGAREAHGWPQLHQLRRGPQKTQTRGSEVTGPQAAGPPLQEQGLVSAPSEGCPPPAQPLSPPSVCSCAGSCPLVAGRARRGETLLCQRLFWVPGAFPPHERGLVTCPSSGPVAGLHLGGSLPSSGSGGGVGAGRSWEGASLHWCKVGTFHLLLFIRLSTLFST